jgi:CheY-like chemotaxis protein
LSVTLLCIDDERSVLTVRKMVLEARGYRVFLAESGHEGLKVLEKETVHAVILDYRMPEMNGDEVAARIRAMRPKLPIIMLSAYVDLTSDQLKDVDAYITKGESPEVLLRALERLAPKGIGHAV